MAYVSLPTFSSRGLHAEPGLSDANESTSYTPQVSTTDATCRKILARVRKTPEFSALVEREFATIVQALKATHRCDVCALPYTLWDSVGRHECRTHPGYFDHGSRTWTCCGRHRIKPGDDNYEYEYRVGCTASDHQSTATDRVSGRFIMGLQQIPLPVYAILPQADERIVASFRQNFRANPYLTETEIMQLEGQLISRELQFEICLSTSMQHPAFLVGGNDMCNYTVYLRRVALRS